MCVAGIKGKKEMDGCDARKIRENERRWGIRREDEEEGGQWRREEKREMKDEKYRRSGPGSWWPDPVSNHAYFWWFYTLFSGELFQETTWKLFRDLPSPCYTSKIMKFGLVFGNNTTVGAATLLARNPPNLKPFCSSPTNRLSLTPRTSPKHWLERRSWFEDESTNTHSRVSNGF